MKQGKDVESVRPGWFFKLLNTYIRFFLSRFYFRKVYSVAAENIPQHCPVMVISNHQNSLCDPLCLLLDIPTRKERKFRVITRGSAFNNKMINRFLRWLGLLPAYRLAVDGEEALENNTGTFEAVSEELLHDGTVIIFPEGKHQNKHWLGEFSSGYLRMLFDAAAKSNYEKELFILPTCNHYSDYFAMRGEMLIAYGTPISLKPYYELYKTKPRTAQRQVNALARQRVSEMMLNITDLKDYDSIDFIRNTYGRNFARKNSLNPDVLPEKLESDKKLVACLESLKVENGELVGHLYEDVRKLEADIRKMKIEETDFDKKCSFLKILCKGLLFVLLFPLFLFSYVPNLLNIYVPHIINRKVKDPMMHSAVRILVTTLLTVPVTCVLILVLLWVFTGSLVVMLLGVALMPLQALFFISYSNAWRRWRACLKFYLLKRQGAIDGLAERRNHIYEILDTLL